jgi:hypothetical protein
MEQLQAQLGKPAAITKGMKKSKSLETLDQYQAALGKTEQRRAAPSDGRAVEAQSGLQREPGFFSSINDGDASGQVSYGVQVPMSQPAMMSGLASLDVDIRHAGAVYRFTAPRGETTITVRAVSESAFDKLMRFGLALLVVAVAWLIFRFALAMVSSSLRRPKAGRTLILLGVLSVVTGVLPVAGLAMIGLGAVLAVRGYSGGSASAVVG